MTITFAPDAGEIITSAMEQLGLLSSGASPKTAENTTAIRQLNFLLKTIPPYAPWRANTATATFAAATASAALSPRPVEVTEARRIVAADTHIQMTRIDWEEYNHTYPNKTQSGEPSVFALKYDADSVTMYVWPVPTASTDIAYSYQEVIADITATSDAVGVAQHWLEYIQLTLAVRLAAPFGATRTDPATVQMLAQQAEMARRVAIDRDRPPSYYLEKAAF